jgi:multiple sugar transport system substrate-binding protein
MYRIVSFLAAVLLFGGTVGGYLWIHAPQGHDGRVHIRYMAWGNPEQQATDERVIEEFERRNTDIKVEMILIPPGSYQQKLHVMLESATEPDVFRMDLYVLPKFFPYGYFAPLDEFIARDTAAGDFDIKDFIPQAIEEVSYQGRVYGMNTSFGGKVLYYNKDLFRAAGLPDPFEQYKKGEWTMEAMVEAARRLTKRDATGYATQFGLRLDNIDLWWVVWNFGGEIMTPPPQGRYALTDEKSLEGLRFYASLLRGTMGPGKGVMPLPGEGVQGSYTFESGTVGMTNGFAGEAPRYRRLCQFAWDVAPVPSGPGGRHCLLKGNGLLMSARSGHKDAAWRLIKFMTGTYAEGTYCGDSLRRAIPTRIGMYSRPEYLTAAQAPFNVETFTELYRSGHRLPVTDRWNDWQNIQAQWLDRLARGTVTPEECARGSAEEIKAKFAELDRKAVLMGLEPEAAEH